MRISQKSRSFPTLEERCDQSCESAGLALSHQECEGFESNEIIGGALRQISQSECWVCPAVLSYIMTDNYNWVFLSAQASFYKAEDLLVNRIIPIRPLPDSLPPVTVAWLKITAKTTLKCPTQFSLLRGAGQIQPELQFLFQECFAKQWLSAGWGGSGRSALPECWRLKFLFCSFSLWCCP